MRKRNRLFKTFVRPKEYEYKQDNCSYAIGASHNLDPTNNNPLVVCFSNPQMHSVTRGYMSECSHTLNAAACLTKKRNPIVLNFQGSKGNNVVTDDGTCPTINSMHGHDVHVVCCHQQKKIES